MTFGVVACIASLVSARGRRLGDVFAGTLVVRERVPAGPGGYVPPPPPWLAGRFAELDLSAVPDGLWLAVRQYLTRIRQLDPQVGWSMAERLAADVAGRTGAPVPPGLPPAMYLAAMLHERQTREAQRTFGGGAVAPVPATGAGRRRRPSRGPAVAAAPVVRPVVPPEGAGTASSGGPAQADRPSTGVRAAGLTAPAGGCRQPRSDGGDSRSSSSMPGAARTTSPARCTVCCSPVSRAVTWYASTVRGPLSVACVSLSVNAQDWSTVRGRGPGR